MWDPERYSIWRSAPWGKNEVCKTAGVITRVFVQKQVWFLPKSIIWDLMKCKKMMLTKLLFRLAASVCCWVNSMKIIVGAWGRELEQWQTKDEAWQDWAILDAPAAAAARRFLVSSQQEDQQVWQSNQVQAYERNTDTNQCILRSSRF